MDNTPEYFKEQALKNYKEYKRFKDTDPENANKYAQRAAVYNKKYRESQKKLAKKRSSSPLPLQKPVVPVSEKGIPNLFRKATAGPATAGPATAAPATAGPATAAPATATTKDFQDEDRMTLSEPEVQKTTTFSDPEDQMTLSEPKDQMTLSEPENPFSRITRNPSDKTLEEDYAKLERLVNKERLDQERLDQERLDQERLDQESLDQLMEELRLQEEKEQSEREREEILQRQSEREREEMFRRREEEYKGRTGKLLNPLTIDEYHSSFQAVPPSSGPLSSGPPSSGPPSSVPPSSGPLSSGPPSSVTQSVVVPAAAGPSSVIPPGARPSIPAQIHPFLGPSAAKPITNKTRKKLAVNNMETELTQLRPKLTRRINKLGFSESLKNPPNKAILIAKPKANPNICNNIFINGLNVNKKFFYPSQFPNLTRIKPIMVTMKKNDNSDKKDDKKSDKRKSRKLRKNIKKR